MCRFANIYHFCKGKKKWKKRKKSVWGFSVVVASPACCKILQCAAFEAASDGAPELLQPADWLSSTVSCWSSCLPGTRKNPVAAFIYF